LADEVIRHLTVAHYTIIASIQYRNDYVKQSAQAYAKVAGRDWTFYVMKLKVIIGRPRQNKSASIGPAGEQQHQSNPEGNGVHASPRSPLADMAIDIDIGPDLQVSRLHAEISYDTESGRWMILVNGRNGLHLDNQRLERGQQAWLQSGNVISILGTQMMFMLPGTPPIIHPEIRKQLLGEDEDMPESDPKDEKQLPPASGGRGRGRGTNSFHPVGNHGPRSYNMEMDAVTPLHPGSPLARKDATQPRAKPSPTYNRGVMMETTEEIDYSADTAKDIKPPHSYAAMIGQAILSTPEQNATLSKIYDYIKENYAYFRHNGGGWQNSIRHNLSLSKSFEKIPRRTDEPGKGMKWQIVPEHLEDYLKKNILPTRKIRHVGSSGPNSPANLGPVAQTERLMGVIGQSTNAHYRGTKRSRSISPSLQYPHGEQSYTPDRPQRASFITGPLPVPPATETPPRSEQITPIYSRGDPRFQVVAPPPQPSSHLGGGANNIAPPPEGLRSVAFNSPPTLTSSQYDHGGLGGTHLFTPLVARSKPSATIQQSTCKAPSFYAKELFSSPAPFWRYVDIGSTPARLPDMSPSKPAGDEDEASPVKGNEDGEEGDEKPALLMQPSSPPIILAPEDDEEEITSPTRTVSRPASRSIGSHPPAVTAPAVQNQGDMDVDQTQDAAQDIADTNTPSKPPGFQLHRDAGEAAPTSNAFAPRPSVLGLATSGALNANMNAGPLGAGTSRRGMPYARMDLEDDDEDGGVDLTK
jgi:forkhead protein FKH